MRGISLFPSVEELHRLEKRAEGFEFLSGLSSKGQWTCSTFQSANERNWAAFSASAPVTAMNKLISSIVADIAR
jgi:hypothetical protein